MYPNISPDLKIKTTISDPLEPEKVIGFEARNTKLGRPAIVMKEDAIEDGEIRIPPESSDEIIVENAELAVLDDDVVLSMNSTDFAAESVIQTFEGRGQAVSMHTVKRDSDSFLSWHESMVEVGN